MVPTPVGWPRECQRAITVKELLPIVIATALWGGQWAGKTVRAQCDNAAVVAVLNSCTSRESAPAAMSGLPQGKEFLLHHIQGSHNMLADALSMDNSTLFHTLLPQANRAPAPIPASLLDVLVVTKPDWTSPHWTRLWSYYSSVA